jgi:hypothetical protein
MNSLRSAWWRAVILLAAFLAPAAAIRSQEIADPTGSQDSSASTASTNPSDPSALSASSGDTAATATQGDNSSATLEPGVEGLERIRGALPAGSFGETPTGVPYSTVLNTTGADVNDINIVGGHPVNTDFSNAPKIGGAEGSLLIEPFNGGLLVPFLHRGTEPEDANIKAGPFYVKFHSIDGLALYDDNYNESQTDRKSEILVLLRLNLTVIAQLTDDLQFALSGDLAYLPLQNQVGIQSSIYNSLGLLATGPLLAAQLVYDTVIAGWPVTFADDFRSGTAIYSDDTRDNFDLFQGDYLQRENDGRYTFLAGRTNQPRNNGFDINPQNSDLVYFANTISALTDRLLPGDVRLTVRVENQELWYNQSNRGLPASRDDLYTSLVSERENLRFKPYVSYEATYVDTLPGITQIVRGGFFGPIDDQLFLRAEAGYYMDGFNHQGVLYRLNLDHDAGPYTTEHFTVDRDLNYFDQELRTSEYYNLNQVLGPTLGATLFLANSSYQELISDGVSSRTEELGGIQLAWSLGPLTNLQLAAIYERQNYSDGLRFNTFTGRVILNRSVSDTLTLQLLYEYQHAISNQPGDSYYNNLVYFRIVKFLE